MAIVTTSTNLSSVTYTTGEVINIQNNATLVINSTPVTRPGTILCITSGKCRVVNDSLTTPIVVTLDKMTDDYRFEGNGIFEVRGQMIELSAGNNQLQVWNLSSMPMLSTIPDITYVEVETVSGSDTYKPWPILEVDPLYYNINRINGGFTESAIASALEVSEVFFYHNSIKQLKTGDGINGSTISDGRKIRIPNIYFHCNVSLDSTLVYSIQSAGTPTGGNFTITAINRNTNTVIGTTSAIPFNATAVNITNALTGLLGSGRVTSVAGGPLPTIITGITLASIYSATPLALTCNTNLLSGTTSPTIFATENAGTNLCLVDLNPSGTADIECASFSRKIRWSNSTFFNSRLIRVGLGGDALTFSTTTAGITLCSVHAMINPFTSILNSSVAGLFGDVYIDKLVITARNINTGASFSNLPSIKKCEDIKLYSAGSARTSVSPGSLLFQTMPDNVNYVRPVCIGGRMRFGILSNSTVISPRHADDTSNVSVFSATNTQAGITFENGAKNIIITDYGHAGQCPPRNTIISVDATCQNISFFGGNISGGNNTFGIINPNNNIVSLNNFKSRGLRSGPLIDQTGFTTKTLAAKKIFSTFDTAPIIFNSGIEGGQDFIYDLVTCPFSACSITLPGVENYVGGNFTDIGLSPTSGSVIFGPFARGTSLTTTGVAYTDQNGTVLYTLSGDSITATIPFAMHGVTSFLPLNPRYYLQGEGVVANAQRIINEGGITGGTFTISIFTSAGALTGTTPVLPFNASTTQVTSAINTIIPGTVSTGGSLAAGYTITLPTGTVYRFSVSGTNLTGGTSPGLLYVQGRHRMLSTETNVGSGFTVDFQVRNGGSTTWPDNWSTLAAYNLSAAITNLVGYDPYGSGLEARIRVIRNSDDIYSSLNIISLFTSVNPDGWIPTDSYFTINGTASSDLIDVVRLSDNTVLYQLTGSGIQSFVLGDNYNTVVYFIRKDSIGNILMRSTPTTKTLVYGNNGSLDLYYGTQIQLAQSTDVTAIKSKIDLYLDAAISSRLPTITYTSPDNATIASIKVDTNAIRPNTGLIPALL